MEIHQGIRSDKDYQNTKLWRADPARTRVGDIGANWGFTEASSFTRSFNSQFGVPPSQVLGQGLHHSNDRTLQRLTSGTNPRTDYMRWFEEASELNERQTEDMD